MLVANGKAAGPAGDGRLDGGLGDDGLKGKSTSNVGQPLATGAGLVTIPGQLGRDLAVGLQRSTLRQAGLLGNQR